jgi:subtilisin family serine protease
MKAIAAILLAWCVALPTGAAPALPVPAPDQAAAPALPAPATDQAAALSSRQLLVMLRLPPQHYQPDAAYSGRYPNDSGRAARRRAAEELASAHGLKLVDDWPMPVIGIDCYLMERSGDASLAGMLEALSRDARVMWAQPMHEFHGLGGGDPLYAVQPAAKYWHIAELHKASTGRDVRVAVIDSGIDAHHPDLAGKVQLRENFVDATPDAAEAHGTAIAGIIAARADNGYGIAGVAPDARLLALRACWPDSDGTTRCNSFTLGKALNFAIMNRAKIVNLSLSGPGDRLLQTLLDVAAQRGMAVIGAVDPQRADGGFPASYPGVIAVAMAANGNSPAPADVLFAPGQDIPTTAPGARWGFVSGSSYATAHVAALAALLAQLQPAANGAQLRRDILTLHHPADGHDRTVSAAPLAQAGNIDACATIARITGGCACLCTPIAATTSSSP